MNGISYYAQFETAHKPQLITSGIPEQFWETLCNKLYNHIYDAGDAFSLMLIDYDDDNGEQSNSKREEDDPIWTVMITKPGGIKARDPKEIYLIDHAWTYSLDVARERLRRIPGLLNRMSKLMGFAGDDGGGGGDSEIYIESDSEEKITNRIDKVLKDSWKYSQMYTLGGNENIPIERRMPIWYIMDEFGSGINHSDKPTFRVCPFFFIPENTTFSILFPIVDCAEGQFVTRDFIEGTTTDERLRNALLIPWKSCDFKSEEIIQHEPDMEYFLAGHIEESLPLSNQERPIIEKNRPLKVYTEYELIKEYLTSTSFEIVNNETDADILWLTHHFKNYRELSELSPNKFINQFPFENVLTIKDLLSIVCRRLAHKHSAPDTLETYPKWLPTTYNLKTELISFISYYQQRKDKQLDNHWIIKPWNLARGLDITITDNLSQIMRLQPSGPKIAQKYIEKPVLFNRSAVKSVKFDVRYVIVLKSVNDPLDIYIYKNFFLRFANKPFKLNNFDNYQQHFTVMNYYENVPLCQIKCEEFLELWQQQYPQWDWENIESDICEMIKQVFMGAVFNAPPCGIGKSLQSRAMYAADIILAWENDKIQPKLLEINWIPDCKRACQFYPEFFNDIFKLLFLDEFDSDVFKNIKV